MSAHTACSATKFNVKLYEPTRVAPAERSDDHKDDAYFLSNVDQTLPGIVETVYCFKGNEEMKNENPAKVIGKALEKILAIYYPVAGRPRINSDGKFYIQCTGEGAVFVEADADCCVHDILSDVTKPDFNSLGKLVYRIPGPQSDALLMPPLVAQVTRFKCGGFVLGLAMNHVLYDGLGSMQFLNSWAEIARDVPLSVHPFFDRTFLRARDPLSIEFPHLELSNIEGVTPNSSEILDERVQYKYFCFDSEKVEELKRMAMEDGAIAKCSSLQVLSAHVWRCRTKALQFPANQRTKLGVAVDIRNRFEPPFPQGYFGNATYHGCSICSAGELLEKPLSFGVGLVQNAIDMVTDRYLASAIDYLEINSPTVSLNYNVAISSWLRLPFHGIDFGWGEPLEYGPASHSFKELLLFLSRPGKERKSIDVLVGLPFPCMLLFEEYIRI